MALITRDVPRALASDARGLGARGPGMALDRVASLTRDGA
jgi:hypothetical protein